MRLVSSLLKAVNKHLCARDIGAAAAFLFLCNVFHHSVTKGEMFTVLFGFGKINSVF